MDQWTNHMSVLKYSLLSREALRKAFPLKNEHDIDELANTAQAALDNTEGILSYQKLFFEVTST